MKNFALFSLLTFAFISMTAVSAQAAGNIVPTVTVQSGQTSQYGQYGTGIKLDNITIDKKVASPTKTKGGVVSFVDNLSSTDQRYAPGQTVTFKVKVKNTSDSAVENIMVRDVVPDFLEPVEGPGAFDKATRTVNYTIPKLSAGQEKEDTLTMQIVAQAKLPADKGLICLTNKAEVPSANISDFSQFCIEKQVTGVAEVPTAGPEMGIAMLAGSFATLLGGLRLRKRS